MDAAYVQRICGLDNKKAIVTGAGSGIGRAAAISLARLGAHVTLVGRRDGNIGKTEDIIKKAGGSADRFAADQSDSRQIEELFAWYDTKHGGPDILIANAGINLQQTVLNTVEKDARTIIDNNYMGTLLVLQAAAERMKEAGSGSITVVTSINARQAVYTEAVYSSVKAALENLVSSAAVELAEFGVRVNIMEPGATLTGMSDLPEHPEKKALFDHSIPLQHVASPEEMGEVIALMQTHAFRYMTGSTITVDGGLLLRKSVF